MSDWTPPKGYTLTKHEGHFLNAKSFACGEAPANPMPDRSIDVAWFDEDEPFVWKVNTGESHPHPAGQPSDEAIAAFEAGTPMEGWSPNVTMRPIKDGWVPPVYMLHADDDDTPVTEPHEGSVA